MKPKVVVSNWVHPEVLEGLSDHCRVVPNPEPEPFPEAVLREHCRDADGLIAFMTDRVDGAFLDHCPRLRIVACALKGHDNFDVEACSARGVWVSIVPDLLTAPTAELAVGSMIALSRHLRAGDAHVRSGAFAGWRPRFYGASIDGATVGIVGAGAIGLAIARRLQGFGCRLLYHDRRRLQPEWEAALRLRSTPLSDLLPESDFVVLGLPLCEDTVGLVDAAFLGRMRAGAFLINPARGSLVDEVAVADALEAGRLGGYAADVFAMEDWARADRPTAVEPRLIACERTVLTPHIGSAVDAVRREIAFRAADSVLQALGGERPDGAVNEPRRMVFETA